MSDKNRQLFERRSGFALPMSILALALITAAIVASNTATSAEIVANNAMRAQDRAAQYAQVGLQQFLLRRGEVGFCSNCVVDPTVADSEWTRVNLSGGYANVVAMRVRPRLSDDMPALFFIRSIGVDTTAKLSGAGSTVFATRTVGQYATFGTAAIKPIGALTSLQGFTNSASGNQVPVAGSDECGAGPAIPGVVVPKGRQYGGNGTPPTGSPALDSSMTLDSLKKRVGIDWNAIVNFNAIPADITIPGQSWPAWWRFIDPTYWPVIRVKQNYTVPGDGRGIIIADSNLTFSASNTWDGIVLVGGVLTSTGSDTTSGVVITGLNRTLPGAINPPDGMTTDNDFLNNSKRFRFNSCKAAAAAARLRVYFAWSNTWVDNVAVW
jgi:hypothetical protein